MSSSGRLDRALLGAAGDFTHFSWPQGVTGLSDSGTRRFRVASPHYLADFDINTGVFARFLTWDRPVAESEAFDQAARAGAGPPIKVQFTLETSRGMFNAFGWKNPAAGLQVLETGKYVTWVRLTDLEFRDAHGEPYGAARPELEIVFWADKVHVIGRAVCQQPTQVISLTLSLSVPKDDLAHPVKSPDGTAVCLPLHRIGVIAGRSTDGNSLMRTDGEETRVESVLYDEALRYGQRLLWLPGKMSEGVLQIVPLGLNKPDATLRRLLAAERRPASISLSSPGAPDAKPAATYDALHGWYSLPVPPPATKPRQPPADSLHTLRVKIDNASRLPQRVRLRCAMDYPCPITGTCPIVRDADGFPIGLPVQISKNWHGMVYLHAHTVVAMPPQSRANFEIVFAYEEWGGKPAASHAQLCLVGWDSDPGRRSNNEIRTQVWEEMALGCRGEHICYDPDICQRRSFVDDMRALLIIDMQGGDRGFSSNVGGADFLVCWPTDKRPEWQWPVGAITHWRKCGPNLTETVYEFTSADSKIRGRVRARSFATDDMTRAIYDLRCDVLADADFARLALFTLGADRYNGNVNRKAAWGDPSGMFREWVLDPPKGEGYLEQGLKCASANTWFALYDETHKPTDHTGGANRGLVIRSYRARIEGRESNAPLAGLRLNSNAERPSVILEIQPDANGRLKAGDFVEMQVEMLVYPQSAAHYLGPNKSLKQLLAEHGDSYHPVLAAAAPTKVNSTIGTVVEEFPVRVRVDSRERAQFTIGGSNLRWTPICIEGFRDYRDIVLEVSTPAGWKPLDQSVHGNDFWQMAYDPADGTFAHIVCLPPGPQPVTLRASRPTPLAR